MRAARLNDVCQCFGTAVRHPFSPTGWGDSGFPWLLYVDYTLGRRYGVGVLVGEAMAGATFGYREPLQFLSLEYEVSMLAAVFSYEPRAGFRVGVGPAVYTTTISQTSGGSVADQRRDTKTGLLLDGSIDIPTHSRWFADVRAQYRNSGAAIVGPFTSSTLPNQPPTVLPATSVSYGHAFVGAGVGVRF